tara:strand:+ start:64 stop:834 length:771 start_codon:yes stop_codon:yes gene_type:complete
VLTILSPAKAMDFSAPPISLAVTQPTLVDDAALLMRTCKALEAKDLEKLMKLSDSLAQLNHARFQDMRLPLTPDNAKPCVLAFKGDVYKGLDAASFKPEDLTWAQERLRILSGLYGLLRPLDLIQPYRLEMGTKLANERGANLYEFWGDRLANSLNNEDIDPEVPVLNLASQEYAKAVPQRDLQRPLLSAIFKEEQDGKLKTIGIFAKRARGLMARYLIRNRIDEFDALKDFNDEGYNYQPALSNEEQLVFTRLQG